MAAHGNHSKIGETMRKSVQRVARAGKGGDTRLAHVNPAEERMLKASGGSGKTNKKTGLKAFEGGQEDRVRFAESGAVPKGFIKDPSVKSGAGSGMEGSVRIIKAPVTAPVATKAKPKPAASAVAAVPAAAPAVATATPKPTPIAQTLIGAINQSSGNTKSSLLNKTAVKRAAARGTSSTDLVSSVDQSRARSAAKGIVTPIDQSGL